MTDDDYAEEQPEDEGGYTDTEAEPVDVAGESEDQGALF